MTEELEDTHTQSSPEPAAPAHEPFLKSPWLRVGLGLVGLVLILALAWPELRHRVLPQPGSVDVSLTELEQAAVADPEDDVAQYELAGALYRDHRFDEAWAQFRAVAAYQLAADASPDIVAAEQEVQASPASKEAHFRLGTAWARAQLLVPAEIAFQQAIALDDRYVDAHANLGVVYYQMGRLSDALSEYDAALAVSPNDADVHYNKGAAYVQQALQVSPPDEALLNQGINELQRTLEINPDLPQVHFSLGVVYANQGQNQEAISEFQRFLELDDGSDPEATSSAQEYLTKLNQ